MADEMSVDVTVSYKIQPAQYESAEVRLTLNGVTLNHTDEDIQEMLDGPGKISYQKIVKNIRTMVQKTRDDWS